MSARAPILKSKLGNVRAGVYHGRKCGSSVKVREFGESAVRRSAAPVCASALRGSAILQYVVKGGRSSALTDCWVERL